MNSKYLEFEKLPKKWPNAKTDKWTIASKSTRAELGIIEWHSPWRRYVFYPYAGTIWDTSCLADVMTFIMLEMENRK